MSRPKLLSCRRDLRGCRPLLELQRFVEQARKVVAEDSVAVSAAPRRVLWVEVIEVDAPARANHLKSCAASTHALDVPRSNWKTHSPPSRALGMPLIASIPDLYSIPSRLGVVALPENRGLKRPSGSPHTPPAGARRPTPFAPADRRTPYGKSPPRAAGSAPRKTLARFLRESGNGGYRRRARPGS